MTQDELIDLARTTALAHSLDRALVCAICEQESKWHPWSYRFERAFFAKYVAPLYTKGIISASEAYARAFSWGLMQVMGETAREMGFAADYESELCDPAVGLDWGCIVLTKKLQKAGGEITKGLLYWNGGSNPLYPGEVIARMDHYK